MATYAFSRLFGPLNLAVTAAGIWTSTGLSVIKFLLVSNVTDVEQRFYMGLTGYTNSTIIYYGILIPPNDSLPMRGLTIPVNNSETVWAAASAASSVNLMAAGVAVT